ncbi:MAG: tRNA (adenosine(37)-N6)-threonylcarbamoyltransferase complex ATPase subunit type 1 TsaE [Verrucomicrobia bacterium]|nr:tRNA (adenosine(37)-N6)-threonylcarbamoyltransferase complex ATPase subunit type 1 TsaE [Verrucomicrobiota bacterium]
MTTFAEPAIEEVCRTAEETRTHAARLLPVLVPGTIIRLHGPLGAGKSEWVRGLASALGITGEIPSPTFTLCQPFLDGKMPLEHWDLYRLENARDWESLGWPDCLVTDGLVAVEWPDRYPGVWPASTLDLQIEPQSDGGRVIRRIRK